MSGFEIAGVVLGALPLVISVYEVYRERTKDIFEYSEAMNGFLRALHLAHARLRHSVEKILQDLVDDQLFAELLNNPKTRRWSDLGLDRKLRERLGDSYFGYVETIKTIRGSIALLERLIGHDEKSKWAEVILLRKPRFHKSIWKRLKLCIDHDKHAKLLDSLERDTAALERLTDDNIGLEPSRRQRQRRTGARGIKTIRQFARSLHRALGSSWLCSCQQPHYAHVRLEDKKIGDNGPLHFKVLFSYNQDCTTTAPQSWHMGETMIESHQISQPARPTMISFSGVTGAAPTPQVAQSAVAHPKIDDLCAKLSTTGTAQSCLGFLDDPDGMHYVHMVVPSPYMTGTVSPVSLRSVLSGQPPTINIHDRHKYELAVALAASVLYLSNTPWLKERWSTEDVLVLPSQGQKAAARCAYISRPFSSPSFIRANTTPSEPRPTVRNEATFALGVALIELSLGKPLDSFVTPQDLDPNGQRLPVTDFMVARRLVHNVENNEGQRYTDVVDRCIWGRFDGLEPDLGNEKFGQSFYEDAVVVLNEVLQDFIK